MRAPGRWVDIIRTLPNLALICAKRALIDAGRHPALAAWAGLFDNSDCGETESAVKITALTIPVRIIFLNIGNLFDVVITIEI